MKRIILLLTVLPLLANVQKVVAQDYIPIPLDSTWWKVYFYNSEYGCDCYYYETTCGDTVIGTQHYTLINRVYNAYCQPACAYHGAILPRAAIRQDSAGRKVYVISLPDSVNESILYDFTQNIGDTCNSILYRAVETVPPIIIIDIDSVNIDGVFHRRLKLQGGLLFIGAHYFIEGIGSTHGLIDELIAGEGGNILNCVNSYGIPIFPDSSFNCDSSTISIEQFKEPGEQIVKIYPLPVTDEVNFEFSGIFGDIEICIFNGLMQKIASGHFKNASLCKMSIPGHTAGVLFYSVLLDNKVLRRGKLVAIN